MIPLKGNEQVLDIGTGRGLLMIGIAKKLTTGKSIGIDIWSQADLSANSYENAIKNAELEGVREKVEVKNMDAQNMTFADNSFDVIVSNLCIHNISKKAGRDKVCREIARVLKPGGMVLISDIKAKRYADELQKAGLKTSRCGIYFDLFPPIDIIKGVKNPQNLIR
jgi:ubiquinone/menaquinone biosynthesis C-methylase UbiE